MASEEPSRNNTGVRNLSLINSSTTDPTSNSGGSQDDLNHYVLYNELGGGVEEAILISIVMTLWMGSLVLFWVRWKKIRVLEPYQPQFYEAQHDPVCPMVAQQACYTPITPEQEFPFGFPIVQEFSPNVSKKEATKRLTSEDRACSSAPQSKYASANSLTSQKPKKRCVSIQPRGVSQTPQSQHSFSATSAKCNQDALTNGSQSGRLGDERSEEDGHFITSPKAVPSTDIRIVIQPRTSVQHEAVQGPNVSIMEPNALSDDGVQEEPNEDDEIAPLTAGDVCRDENGTKRRPTHLNLLLPEEGVVGRIGLHRKSLANLVDEVALYPRQSRSSSIFRLGQRPQAPACRFCRRETVQMNRHPAAILSPALRRTSRQSTARKMSNQHYHPCCSSMFRTSPRCARKDSNCYLPRHPSTMMPNLAKCDSCWENEEETLHAAAAALKSEHKAAAEFNVRQPHAAPKTTQKSISEDADPCTGEAPPRKMGSCTGAYSPWLDETGASE